MSASTDEATREAEETLAYIRTTMETAGGFTPISGWGLVLVGLLGLAAAIATSIRSEGPADPTIWIPTAVLAIVISTTATAKKGNKLNIPLWSGSFRKLAWVMTPALVAGGMLTFALDAAGSNLLIPGTWLALYGAAVTAGGTQSARDFRWMGLCFLALGAIAFVRPEFNIWLLGIGFGGLHIAFGFRVAGKYGG